MSFKEALLMYPQRPLWRGRAMAGILLALSITPLHAFAQPANDNCSTAQVISVPGLNIVVTVAGSSLGATSSIPQTCALSDSLDVWYSFTAPAAGLWYFDTIGSVLFDTTLSAYAACDGAQLACNDDIDVDNAIFWSALTLRMTAGQTVKLRVAAVNGDSDIFQINVVGATTSTNDSCSTPQNIFVNQPVGGSTLLATDDFTLPAASCGMYDGSGGGRDVFFAFTPTVTAPYTISLCGSTFDTVLGVLTDCSGSAESVVACNDDSVNCADSHTSQIQAVGLSAGVRYLIRVAGFDYEPPDLGDFMLMITAPEFGVCCRGATCSLITPAQCATYGQAGLDFGDATTCNGAGVANRPCCYADYNKVNGITVQDIFDFLTDWFTGSFFAQTGGIGNGTPNVQSIFDFLSAWFAGGC
jgi:hypothetical protein